MAVTLLRQLRRLRVSSWDSLTEAMADILQAIAAFTVFAVDTCLMQRPRDWNYRRMNLHGNWDCSAIIERRSDCIVCAGRPTLR